MKTILGAEIRGSEIYKNAFDSNRISGQIWTNGEFNILIRNGKFLLQNKEGGKHGHILNGTPAHRKVKRIIARRFSTYRTKGIFIDGTDYWKFKVNKIQSDFAECRREILLKQLDYKTFYELQS